MKPRRLRSLLGLAVLLLLASCGDARDVSATDAARPDRVEAADAAAVTAENLLANERYWPYRVALREQWHPPGADEPLPARLVGVLIRVGPSGRPRIDFARRGKYEVPIEKTDLLERADQIRLSSAEKTEPNFVHAIKSRMLDSAADALRPLPAELAQDRPGFLCVFADPAGPDFAQLARALAPLRERHGVMTILFPQGAHADAALRDRLRSLEWTVPFLYDFLSEPYTRTLLSDETPMPYVLLQTNEGRVLLQSIWSTEVVPELAAALERAFGA